MDHAAEPRPPDPEHQLQWDVYRLAANTLRETLPPPAATDAPELWELRLRVALAEVAAMVPANAREAAIAARSVAAGAHVDDCTRQIGRFAHDPKRAAQLLAQAASMGRQERGYCGMLLRLQAARQKRETNDATCDSDALTVHCVWGMLGQGLESLPPLPPVPAPPPPAPAAPEAEPAPDEVPPPRPLAWSDLTEEEQRKSLLLSEADRYALYNTVRVQQIRKLGGLPPDCDYEPPRPEILDLIINGDTSNLRWADTYVAWVPPSPMPAF